MTEQLLIALCSLLGLAIMATVALTGFQGWLNLKARELELRRPSRIDSGSPEGAARIEIADLKERIRKLEAIASGVDL
jgi:hypothetical protein